MNQTGKKQREMGTKVYGHFALMMGISFILMYAIMFINVSAWEHIMLSINRTYMALLMVSPMALVMLLFMKNMYRNKKINTLIIIVAILTFSISLAGLRTQTPIGDVQWMRGMIPHHSSAIMTSSHANIKDPEAKKLAEEIIRSQEREIAEMKAIIKRLENQ